MLPQFCYETCFNIKADRQLISQKNVHGIKADSWPRSLDDTSAKKDWSWKPTYDMKATVDVMFDLVKQQIEDGKNQS